MLLWMWLLLIALIGLTVTVIWFLFRPNINVAIWMILLLSLGFLIAGFYLAWVSYQRGLIADAGELSPMGGLMTI